MVTEAFRRGVWAQHGEWLAHNVPNAETIIEEHGGHLPDPNLVTERFGWLVQPA